VWWLNQLRQILLLTLTSNNGFHFQGTLQMERNLAKPNQTSWYGITLQNTVIFVIFIKLFLTRITPGCSSRSLEPQAGQGKNEHWFRSSLPPSSVPNSSPILRCLYFGYLDPAVVLIPIGAGEWEKYNVQYKYGEGTVCWPETPP